MDPRKDSPLLSCTRPVLGGIRRTIEFDTLISRTDRRAGVRANGPDLSAAPVLAELSVNRCWMAHSTYSEAWQIILARAWKPARSSLTPSADPGTRHSIPARQNITIIPALPKITAAHGSITCTQTVRDIIATLRARFFGTRTVQSTLSTLLKAQ